ncbi:hypothetical protein BN85315050 [Paracholeplasma brassicae]|uniref:Uncharacterized protein n=1 Tax=Acholeplasma brassicae TaxID=61635 RepID=U4KQ54_9MOLU|nr:hypothetical protein [Paracholeplasma brassicae]CCV66526.1 hypothetical protein BN85315050 [Paracholeplasma brassicae]
MEDQLIAILKDSDFGLKDEPFFNEETRRSARGLVFLPNNQVALFHKKRRTNINYLVVELKITSHQRRVLEERY